MAASSPSTLSLDVLSQVLHLRELTLSLSPQLLQSVGIDVATLSALHSISANFSSLLSPTPSPSSSSSLPSSSSAMSLSYPIKSEPSSSYIKRHRDSDTSISSLPKRTRTADSHASTPSSDDAFSPRRRRDGDDPPSDDERGDSDSDAGSHSTTPPEPSSPSPSHTPKRRSDEDKQRNELQRKRQHQKSDKQRRAKIKEGMEQLKALVSLHGKLESPDQASIVSASVDLVHSLRSEIASLKAEVDRAKGENQSMRGNRGYGGMDSSHLLRGGLGGGSGGLSNSLSHLSQLNPTLSTLSQLNNHLSSLQGHSLSGLNTLTNLNVLSSLGLPTNINAGLSHSMPPPSVHSGHSPMPMMPMNSPSPLHVPTSTGSGFANSFLSTSPPASNMSMMGYGKEWGV